MVYFFRPVSPPFIPDVGTNIEVSTRMADNSDLSRPEHAAYMKRANTDGQEEEAEGNYKMARIGTGEKGSSHNTN